MILSLIELRCVDQLVSIKSKRDQVACSFTPGEDHFKLSLVRRR